MGCCANQREGKAAVPSSDAYSKNEKEMQLHNLSIIEFQKILRDAAGDRTITVGEIGEAFKQFKFGQMLLAEGDNIAKSLVNHSIFKNRSGQIDWYRLFTLGLLYARGTNAQKADTLILTYDSNNDGDLFTRSVTIFLNSMVQIASVIVPAIIEGKDPEELDEKTEEDVNAIVLKAKDQIFGDEVKVLTSTLKKMMVAQLAFFFDPVHIRTKLGSSENKEEEHDEEEEHHD